MTYPIWKKMAAEGLGTFWLVFAGCGSAVFAAKYFAIEGATPINLGIGLVGVSLAFGLTVLTMAFAIGHVSGCHLNPAVTIGLATAKRFKWVDVGPYIFSQLVGAFAAAGALYSVLSGKEGFVELGQFAANGFGDAHKPGGYSMLSAMLIEAILTAVFLFIILGATDKKAPAGFAPIAIGLGLALIHLVSIPVTNTSVNPARSTSQALFAGGVYLSQLWVFWVGPIAGAIFAGLAHRVLFASPKEPLPTQMYGANVIPGRTASVFAPLGRAD